MRSQTPLPNNTVHRFCVGDNFQRQRQRGRHYPVISGSSLQTQTTHADSRLKHILIWCLILTLASVVSFTVTPWNRGSRITPEGIMAWKNQHYKIGWPTWIEQHRLTISITPPDAPETSTSTEIQAVVHRAKLVFSVALIISISAIAGTLSSRISRGDFFKWTRQTEQRVQS